MTLQQGLSVIAVLVAGSVSLAAEPAQLPKGLPPLSGEAVVEATEREPSKSGWTIALTMRDETWDAIKDVMPEAEWPGITETATHGSIYEGTMKLPISDRSQPVLCRVVNMDGKEIGHAELAKKLKTKKPVLVSVSGQMPAACYLKLPTSASLIVLLGPGGKNDADGASSAPKSDGDGQKVAPAPHATEAAEDDLKDWGKEKSQQYFFGLMMNARKFKIASNEEAAKYMRGSWRLDKRAHVGGGHYVQADQGDDVTVICTDEWLVKKILNHQKPRVHESVGRIEKIVLDPSGIITVNDRGRFQPLDEDHMAVLDYDFIAVLRRISCEFEAEQVADEADNEDKDA
jgi:hypothetical protein